MVLSNLSKQGAGSQVDNSGNAVLQGHVYLIDDNEDIRNHLRRVLQRFGLTVEDYADAESFLMNSVEVAPAVVIMDMVLPGMNGVAVYDLMRQSGRKNPFIFISGQSEPPDIIRAMKMGACDFLWKPFSIEMLVEAVRKALALDEARLASQVRGLLARDIWASLTNREKETCQLVLAGHGNSEISKMLGVFPDTIKKHRGRLMSKAGVATLAELLVIFEGFDLTDF